MNRIFVREESDIEYSLHRSRRKIGIIGIAAGVGTSFIATSLAKTLAAEKGSRIAFLEIRGEQKKPFLYDSLGMDKRFAGRSFEDVYEVIGQGKSISSVVNLDERINWALYLPKKQGERRKLKTLELCSMINNVAADTVICDITEGEDIEAFLQEMDIVVFVIDPLPSKLIYGYDLFCITKKFELMGKNVIWVLNKYNSGINTRECNAFLRIKGAVRMPWISPEEFYSAEYNCKIPISIKAIRTGAEAVIKEIIHLFNT